MSEGLLVINAGSSSIKFSLYVAGPGAEPDLLSHGQVEGVGHAPHFIARDPEGALLAERRWNAAEPCDHETLLGHLLEWIEGHLGDAELRAAGHRVVHGGPGHLGPVLIDDAVIAELKRLIPLAPLHQPHNLSPIEALRRLHPGLSQVACFDTAFHGTNAPVAQMFALPRELSAEGVRRYGFHGLSYEYVARSLAKAAPEIAAGKVVVAHLGSGASMCAMEGGRSVASTMGFTALDGLPMGTRTGAIDPGVILYLMQAKGMDAKAIEHLLYHRSGLLGVSGVSNDMRDLLACDAPEAAEAVDLFVYRIGRELGSLTAALGGLDGLVFTAGIGEQSAEIRARVCRAAAWAGVELDEEANRTDGPHGARRISTAQSRVGAFVIPTDEERMIARHTRRLMDTDSGYQGASETATIS